jgi:hypothetical protein
LKRILNDEKDGDHVLHYVILLCARQLVTEIEKTEPEFRDRHKREMKALQQQVEKLDEVRSRFSFDSPEERKEFFDWFDRWFLTRAERAEEAA